MLLIDHLFGNRPLHHPMDQASQLFPSFVHLNGTSTVVEIPKLTQKKNLQPGGATENNIYTYSKRRLCVKTTAWSSWLEAVESGEGDGQVANRKSILAQHVA